MVFYRKYRPQTIEELDSASVRDTLYSVLENPPHAFLFTGPKGLGKTSTARIVAKAVNCEKRSKIKDQRSKPQRKAQSTKEIESADMIEPCNNCEQCTSITKGTNMDVIEIDAASNRGIDEIRDLREKIWLAPLKAKTKIYIIDEVHMLTTEAFNALLKTLEEPPEHAMFILCTTEEHKIPATINSRCFHVQFNLATDDEIVRSLIRIVKGEKLQVGKEALYAIAKRADGGFRDGAKILEELSLKSKGQKITEESLETFYKTSTIILGVADFEAAMCARDAKMGLQKVAELVEKGVDLKFFIYQVLMDLHKKLLIKLKVIPENEKEFPSNLSAGWQIEDIKILSELLNKAYQDMKYAPVPQLPLELAVIEFSTLPSSLSFPLKGEEIKSSLSQRREGWGEGEKKEDVNSAPTIEKLRREVNNNLKTQALKSEERIHSASSHSASSGQAVQGAKSEELTTKSDIELLQVPANGEVTREWMDILWKSIIGEMKKYNHTIAGVLRSCQIASYDNLPAGRQGKLLVISTGYKFHKERLDETKARAALKDVCKALTGKDVEIEVELSKK